MSSSFRHSSVTCKGATTRRSRTDGQAVKRTHRTLIVWLRLPPLDVEHRVGTELVPRSIILVSAREPDRPVRGKSAREVITVRVSVNFEEECGRCRLGR